MKLLIPVNEDKGMDSTLSEHFGHAEVFAMYNTETKALSFVANDLNHHNAATTPVDQIMVHGPEAVFSLGIGRRAIDLFNERDVPLKTGPYKTVKEVVDNIDSLQVLAGSCSHDDHEHTCDN